MSRSRCRFRRFSMQPCSKRIFSTGADRPRRSSPLHSIRKNASLRHFPTRTQERANGNSFYRHEKCSSRAGTERRFSSPGTFAERIDGATVGGPRSGWRRSRAPTDGTDPATCHVIGWSTSRPTPGGFCRRSALQSSGDGPDCSRWDTCRLNGNSQESAPGGVASGAAFRVRPIDLSGCVSHHDRYEYRNGSGDSGDAAAFRELFLFAFSSSGAGSCGPSCFAAVAGVHWGLRPDA